MDGYIMFVNVKVQYCKEYLQIDLQQIQYHFNENQRKSCSLSGDWADLKTHAEMQMKARHGSQWVLELAAQQQP